MLMSLVSTPKPEIPIYCIETFAKPEQQQQPRFDIKVLESLVEDFPFTNRPHRHDFYDLLIITQGSGTHTIDFVTYEVEPCSIFFLTPGQVHSWNLSRDVRGFSIFFEPEFYLLNRPSGALRDLPFFHGVASEPVMYLDCRQEPFIRETLTNILDEYQTQQERKYDIIRAYLEIFLLKLSRFYQQNQLPRPEQSGYLRHQVVQFETLIDSHFIDTKGVKDYAEMMAMTPKNLNKICKQVLDKTASELIRARVVLEAKRLLLHSDLTINQIVDRLNFYDASYFVKFFKKATGHTPEQFRRENF
jgi:AraC family transcriptional regulator, transcriptional activator of pobA